MFYRLRRRLNYWKFDHLVRDIHSTPPLRITDSNLRILSMVAERDVAMYMIAAKSLYRRIGHGRFVAIIDRDLPHSPRETLRRHLGGAVEFVILEDIPVGRCQRGGTWERLLSCIDWSQNHYVIQMDADALALQDIPQVNAAIGANRAFTIANGVPLQTLAEAAAWMDAHRLTGDHITDVAQRAFIHHPQAQTLMYVRGSSGFAGFAQGGVTRALADDFHVTMEGILGAKRWREWGTEQVASNFVVANSPDPVVLPHPEYSTPPRGTDMSQVRLAHFIGSGRFVGQRMARIGRTLIRDVLSKAS